MIIVASEDYGGEGVRRKVADGIAERGEVVDAAEEGGHVDGHDAGHELGDGEEDGGEVDGEAGVGEEGVELCAVSMGTGKGDGGEGGDEP